MKQIAILGTGSLGSLFAFHCAEHQLYALPRDQHSASHIQVQAPNQHWQAQLPCWQGEPLDWLVVCTKAAATLSALQAWQPYLSKVSNLLLLQNGMGQQQQVADWLQQQKLEPVLWAGMSTEGAYRLNDTVVYAGIGKNLIGLWPQGHSTITALPHTELVTDIKHRLLNKLAINAVINPLTALLRCLNGELVTNTEYREQCLALSHEVSQLYRALGWQLEQPLDELALQVASATAQNRSSTLQDIEAGRSTELPYICGFLLEQAQQIGYPMPLTAKLLHALHI